jgi:hypothetical protein
VGKFLRRIGAQPRRCSGCAASTEPSSALKLFKQAPKQFQQAWDSSLSNGSYPIGASILQHQIEGSWKLKLRHQILGKGIVAALRDAWSCSFESRETGFKERVIQIPTRRRVRGNGKTSLAEYLSYDPYN